MDAEDWERFGGEGEKGYGGIVLTTHKTYGRRFQEKKWRCSYTR
jgi:hypothetical protein